MTLWTLHCLARMWLMSLLPITQMMKERTFSGSSVFPSIERCTAMRSRVSLIQLSKTKSLRILRPYLPRWRSCFLRPSGSNLFNCPSYGSSTKLLSNTSIWSPLKLWNEWATTSRYLKSSTIKRMYTSPPFSPKSVSCRITSITTKLVYSYSPCPSKLARVSSYTLNRPKLPCLCSIMRSPSIWPATLKSLPISSAQSSSRRMTIFFWSKQKSLTRTRLTKKTTRAGMFSTLWDPLEEWSSSQ